MWWRGVAPEGVAEKAASKGAGGGLARRVAWAFALVLLGVAVVVAPVTVRNYAVGGDFVPIASQGGINFYIGNNPESDGASAVMPVLGEAWQNEDAVRIAETNEGRKLRPSEVSGFWYRAGREFVLTNPGAAARLYLRKFVLFWDSFELANNKDIYYFGNMSFLFRWTRWLGFGLVAPLALLGAIAVARRNPPAVLLVLFVLAYMAGLLLFFVNSRFRLPVLPVLILFAAAGVFHVVDAVRGKRIRALFVAAVVLLASGLFVGYDFYDTHVGDRAQTHMTLGRAEASRGDHESAVAEYRRAVEISPNYAKAWNSLGLSLEQLGRDEEALRSYMTAVERDSTLAFARNNIGSFYMRRGDLASARRWLESAVRHDDRLENAHMNLALVLAQGGDFERSEYHLQCAVTIAPDFVEAWNALGRVFEETGRLPQAAGAYGQALSVDPSNVEARHGLGVVLAMAGRYDDALAELERARLLSPGHPGIEANLARVRELASRADR
jgi:Flp pilus assembly protein TadD